MTATVEERVAAGAAWFDDELPEWFLIVNPETLDLSEPCGCIIGQITRQVVEADPDALDAAYAEEVIEGDGNWTDAYAFWVDGFVPGHAPLSEQRQRELGFIHSKPVRSTAETIGEEYLALTAAWRVEIARRLP